MHNTVEGDSSKHRAAAASTFLTITQMMLNLSTTLINKDLQKQTESCHTNVANSNSTFEVIRGQSSLQAELIGRFELTLAHVRIP